MPTYSYRCTECGTAFDAQQAFTDDSLTACPTCGGRLRKLYGSVGVTFNGSGFYRTDSRAGVKADPGSGPESGPGKAEKAGESSSPAATPAASGSGGGAAPASTSANS